MSDNFDNQNIEAIHEILQDAKLSETYIQNVVGNVTNTINISRLLSCSVEVLKQLSSEKLSFILTNRATLLRSINSCNKIALEKGHSHTITEMKSVVAKKLWLSCCELNYFKDETLVKWEQIENKVESHNSIFYLQYNYEQKIEKIRHILQDTRLLKTYILNLVGDSKSTEKLSKQLNNSIEFLEELSQRNEIILITNRAALLKRINSYKQTLKEKGYKNNTVGFKALAAKALWLSCCELNYFSRDTLVKWEKIENTVEASNSIPLQQYRIEEQLETVHQTLDDVLLSNTYILKVVGHLKCIGYISELLTYSISFLKELASENMPFLLTNRIALLRRINLYNQNIKTKHYTHQVTTYIELVAKVLWTSCCKLNYFSDETLVKWVQSKNTLKLSNSTLLQQYRTEQQVEKINQILHNSKLSETYILNIANIKDKSKISTLLKYAIEFIKELPSENISLTLTNRTTLIERIISYNQIVKTKGYSQNIPEMRCTVAEKLWLSCCELNYFSSEVLVKWAHVEDILKSFKPKLLQQYHTGQQIETIYQIQTIYQILNDVPLSKTYIKNVIGKIKDTKHIICLLKCSVEFLKKIPSENIYLILTDRTALLAMINSYNHNIPENRHTVALQVWLSCCKLNYFNDKSFIQWAQAKNKLALSKSNLLKQCKIELLIEKVCLIISDVQLSKTYIQNLIANAESTLYISLLLECSIEFLNGLTLESRTSTPINSNELLAKIETYMQVVNAMNCSNKAKKRKHVVAKKLWFSYYELNYFNDTENLNWDQVQNTLKLGSTMMLYQEQIRQLSPSEEFSESVLTFLNSKNVPKNYAVKYVHSLKSIHNISPKFSDTAIRNGLDEIKNSLLSQREQSTTQYHYFSQVLELFRHLQTSQVINSSVVLPRGLPKPANTNKVRKYNPTIASLSIHKLTDSKELLTTTEYIERYHASLQKNLVTVLHECKSLIRYSYRIYYNTNLSDAPVTKRQKAINSALEEIRKKLGSRSHRYLLNEQEHKLGITSDDLLYSNGLSEKLCGALMGIIIDEIGTNPWPLYKTKVIAEGINTSYTKIESDGSAVLKVIKWRQRHIHRKTPKSGSLLPPNRLKDDDINASFCIQFVLQARVQHAKYLQSNNLWLYENKAQIKAVANDGSHLFNAFYLDHLAHLPNLPKPTLMNIRSSRAVEIYLSSDGDLLKVSAYLGNRVQTALNTYIPLFLQEATYRNKIHNFQSLYLILATCKLQDKLSILKLTSEEYDQTVRRLINNADYGGELYEVLQPKQVSKEQEVCFICSIENFACAIRYVASTPEDAQKNNEMYQVCKAALKKAGKSNVIIQRMLIKAKSSLK